MSEMYRQDSKGAEFKFLHVFSRIENCEKWAEVRLNLGKGKAMVNHWAVVQAACSKWHGIVKEVERLPESGADFERQVTLFRSPMDCSLVFG